MVNVDISPSVILGVGLIGAGVSLWNIRQAKPWISKDYDVVISCISLLVGGILIFQGWRLDPLLLFGQLMTTGAAVSFGVEALRLRSEKYEQDEKAALQDVFRRKGPKGGGDNGNFQLPPPPPPFENEAGWAARRWADDQASASSDYYNANQATPVGMYAEDGANYVEADFYDPYNDQQYPVDGDDSYYRDDGSSGAAQRPSEFEFPPDEPFSGRDSSSSSRRTRYDTSEDW